MDECRRASIQRKRDHLSRVCKSAKEEADKDVVEDEGEEKEVEEEEEDEGEEKEKRQRKVPPTKTAKLVRR